MKATIENYPESCRANISTIMSHVNTDVETTYAMMLLTSTLMDLSPSDPKVVEIILDDCKGMKVYRKDG